MDKVRKKVEKSHSFQKIIGHLLVYERSVMVHGHRVNLTARLNVDRFQSLFYFRKITDKLAPLTD